MKKMILLAVVSACALESGSALLAQRAAPQGFIGGVVRSSTGPEAGVWVIAETKDLPTNFIKIVVTDDQGRYMVPELPAASYRVFVRGYGLVDSTPVQAKPGVADLNLTATLAKTPQEAAKVYPGNYWLSLLEPPAAGNFPGTGPTGNGIGVAMKTQNHFINSLKSDCNFCHQLGNEETRTVDHVLKAKPELKTHAEAWEWRLGTGVRGTSMYGVLNNQGKALLKSYAGWTERIAKGEVPPAPPRPKGVERNIVVTLWDVGDDHSFMHDEISTDKNRPTVNAGGTCTRSRPDTASSSCSIRTRTRPSRWISPRASRGRRCRHASLRRTGPRCIGATSICGRTRRTTRPIRTTRCSTARAASG